jgi:hypothetical protein
VSRPISVSFSTRSRNDRSVCSTPRWEVLIRLLSYDSE